MKKKIIALLQQALGFDNYLYYFSRLKIFMLKRDKYEHGFMQFLELIPPGSTILDIGANIGITSVPIAKKFPGATLHSFEPMPANVTALKRVINYYKLKNVVVHEIALGSENGILKLVMPIIKGVKMQGLCHAYVEGEDEEWNRGEIVQVPVKRLDDIEALQKAEKISAIKIDVENFEYQVLMGARDILAKHQPVIYCELWANEVRDQVIDYLKQFGYAIKVFENDSLVDFTTQDENNFVFIIG